MTHRNHQTSAIEFITPSALSHIYTIMGRIYGTQFFNEIEDTDYLRGLIVGAFNELRVTRPNLHIETTDIMSQLEDDLGLGDSISVLGTEVLQYA